jgi:hypothetical protein
MHHTFDDIRSRIAEPPTWFDSNGTPRYGEFTPGACPNIYADEVALVEIGCQSCGECFMVEMHHPLMEPEWTLKEHILNSEGALVHYGDPPAHGCVGDTMNCLDLRVVQYWHHKDDSVMLEWERVAELEIALPDASEDRS